MIASFLLFVVETLLGMPVLTLSPVLPLVGAMVFVIKAGILSGAFYFQEAANFAVAIAMAWIRHIQACPTSDCRCTASSPLPAFSFLD